MSMSTETFEHLRADINTRILEQRQDDPGLANDLLAYAMRELGKLATQDGPPPEKCECYDGGSTWHPGHNVREYHLEPNPDCPVHFGPHAWAGRVLVNLQSRAIAGGWPEPPEHPWETVLSGDGDLG